MQSQMNAFCEFNQNLANSSDESLVLVNIAPFYILLEQFEIAKLLLQVEN